MEKRRKIEVKWDDNITKWTLRSFTDTRTLARNQDIWRELLNCTVTLQPHLVIGLMMMTDSSEIVKLD